MNRGERDLPRERDEGEKNKERNVFSLRKSRIYSILRIFCFNSHVVISLKVDPG